MEQHDAEAVGSRSSRNDNPTLTEMATQTLRQDILASKFRPGQRLVERDLADQTGVSRTCIRAALQQLEAEGLAERVPRRGLFVAFMTPDEARQIYEVRAALEPVMARMFVQRADDATVAELVHAAEMLERSQDTPAEYVRAFADFYDVLLRGSNNQVAQRFLNMLTARVSYLRSLTTRRAEPGRRGQTVALVRDIARAAEARDTDAMARQCEAFVHRSAQFAQMVLADPASNTLLTDG